jgi:SAM-dependent methyltransferase
MISKERSWRDRVYDEYVSSGQAHSSQGGESPFATRQPYIEAVIRKHFPHKRESIILDLGCGHGAFLYFLRKNGYTRARGVDISAEQVALAKSLNIQDVTHANLLPYLARTESGSIDFVVLFDIIEHLNRDELFETLDEVYRVLRSGGKCLVHLPNGEGLFGMTIRYADLTHEHCLTRTSARQLFSTIGFSSVDAYEERPVVHGITSLIRRIIWDLGTLGPRLLTAAETGEMRTILSRNFLIVARKGEAAILPAGQR